MMPMYFEPTQEQRHLHDSLHKVMKKLVTPEYLRRMDEQAIYPYDAYDAWVELGLTGLGLSPEFGGYGGTIEDLALVSEQLGYWSYDLATAYMVPLFTGQTLLKHGRTEQKRSFCRNWSMDRCACQSV
jgi:alkylation response protein AidB-like acyl-CoA dehydrogenase